MSNMLSAMFRASSLCQLGLNYLLGGLKLSFSPLRAAIVSTGSEVPVCACTDASPTWVVVLIHAIYCSFDD